LNNGQSTMKAKTSKKMAADKKPATGQPTARKRGREFTWTDENIAEYCGLIASGLGIINIGKEHGFPHPTTVYRKMAEDPHFATRIARAREWQQEREMDHCIELADSATPENYNVKKLQIWARQWRASKLAPKRYGDKLDMTTRAETPEITREEMVAMMRKSPSYLASIESMIADAKKPVA